MRIISQNGKSDLPYERVAISINFHDEKEIIAWSVESSRNDNDNYLAMARYSTEEKANKAMEMLRGKYSTIRMQEVVNRNVNQAVFETLQQFEKEKYFSAFFQFPQDDEIDVTHEEP